MYRCESVFSKLRLDVREWLFVAPISQLDEVPGAVGDHQISVPSHGHI